MFMLIRQTRFLSLLLFCSILCLGIGCNDTIAQAQETKAASNTISERLYKKHAQSIYQIRVINLASNEKANLGSGFQISADGYIATNYHVISEVPRYPKQHRIEYLNDQKETGTLTIVGFDVINDLAILKKEDTDRKNIHALKMAQVEPQKGAQIFAMGNPHDIGFTILDGTYNGLSNDSLYQRIHFSGSLNSGMSGGPALNSAGEVIGINVSTAGNQISFLVPVEKLKQLYTKIRTDKNDNIMKNANAEIEEQLYQNQAMLFQNFLTDDWETRPFGNFIVPGKMSDQFSCWGGQSQNETRPFSYYRLTCASDDNLYINRGFSTGRILFRYDRILGNKELSPSRFYSIYEGDYSRPIDMYENGGEEEVTNFKCHNDFIAISEKKWRISSCIRQYKKQKRLFDYHLYMAQLGEKREGFEASAVLQGISKHTITAFQKKFLQSIQPHKSSM